MNPYVEWLGLSESDSRPDFFALFRLNSDEDDVAVIGAAAERAMATVRGCRPGQHGREWTALLDELKLAKATLVDAEKRAQYRRQLLAGSETATSEAPAATDASDMSPPAKVDSKPPEDAQPAFAGAMLPPTAAPVLKPASPKQQDQVVEEVEKSSLPSKMEQGAESELDPMAPVQLPPTHVPTETSKPTEKVVEKIVSAESPLADARDNTQKELVSESTDEAPRRQVSAEPVLIDTDLSDSRSNNLRNMLIAGGVVLVLLIAGGLTFSQLSEFLTASRSEKDGPDSTTLANAESPNESGSNAQASDVDGENGGVVENPVQVDQSGTSASTDNGRSENDIPEDNDPENAQTPDGDGESDSATVPGMESAGGTENRDNTQTEEDSANPDLTQSTSTEADSDTGELPEEKIETSEIIAFGEGLSEVLELLVERNPDQAQARLEELLSSSKRRPQDELMALRMLEVIELNIEFWDAVDAGVAQLKGGEELTYGDDKPFVIVETRPDLLIYRVRGQNDRQAPRQLPFAIAEPIAALALQVTPAERRVLHGAIRAVEKVRRPNLAEASAVIWQEAALMGADVDSLLDFLEDDYDLALTIVDRQSVPSAERVAAATEIVTTQIRDTYGSLVRNQDRIEVATDMLQQTPRIEDIAERFATFEAAAKWAARGGNTVLLMQTLERFEAWFELEDGLERRVDGLELVAMSIETEDEAKETGRTAIEWAQTAKEQDQESLTQRLLAVARQAARESGDDDFVQTVTRRIEDVMGD